MVARRSRMTIAYSDAMLELRPSCELCDRDLPPASTEAMICTFECTFCARCVRETLHNVCPNCGGGFRSEEHTSELQSLTNLVCRLLLEKKKKISENCLWSLRLSPFTPHAINA